MPRPIFGQADWWTFEELETTRFPPIKPHEDGADAFATQQARDASALAEEAFPEIADEMFAAGDWTWPGLEFCVSRGTRTVLMVRRRT